ncbi:GNAT family N-acetyltransferase [Methylobacterium sp. ID0610]|uniref:GNAT family N-acetyltransferase n=1 Tax=Methylobacterium carpenticola TaxID=3344827 RepID=UPI0036802FB3
MTDDARWRSLTAADLAAVDAIAAIVHPDYPEDEAVAAERLALYPDGCFLLESAGRPAGYAISHPWSFGEPPALDSLLGAIPAGATTHYLHDVALLPAARGAGATSALLAILTRQAAGAGLDTLSLVAVNGSVAFWERRGFRAVEDERIRRKLASYGRGARFMARAVPA